MFERASLSTMSLFRRRSNEQHERDVLRHDARLFGVEPLTDAHSFGDVFVHDVSLLETELRAAQPNLHSGRLHPLLQVAARPATSQAG